YRRHRRRRTGGRHHPMERISRPLPAPLPQPRTRGSQHDGACRCRLKSVQNTFATPTATPTDTVTRRTNSAVVGATTFNARPFLRGIDAPESTTAPRSD